MLGILAVIQPIVALLKSVGILKDPAQEAALQQQLMAAAAAAEQAQSEEFQKFLAATTPDPNRVYIWVNSMIAVTRPAITWLVTASIVSSFFIPGVAAQMTATVAAFSNGGTAGLMLLSIPLWWFAGRSAEKIWSGQSNPDALPVAPAVPILGPILAGRSAGTSRAQGSSPIGYVPRPVEPPAPQGIQGSQVGGGAVPAPRGEPVTTPAVTPPPPAPSPVLTPVLPPDFSNVGNA